jgi:tetratricopeptide (TPR) repeat protein
MASAVAEFKQSLSLDPKQPEVMMRLAAALEKTGDWLGSLDHYRNQHLASLKDAGKSAEAAKLEASVATSKAGTGISEKIDASMQAGSNALMQRQWDEAIRNYKQAAELGEKLQPHDGRLAVALGELGRITMGCETSARRTPSSIDS